ncbi:MAG: DNA adenine methylase [Thermosipho sp. (in: Bacteria)]|nr:DNA adenine methylase [Thermosipho sp. (in: thermotogales)]
MNSPIKWQGGKYRLRKQINDLIPKDHICYCEVFGGAAWVLFYKKPSKVEVYNDINGELVNFFKVIKNKYNEFIKEFDYLLISREIFEDFKNMDTSKLSDVKRAVRFYYLVHLSFGSRMTNFVINPTRVAGQGKRILENLEKDILKAKQRLINTVIENRDFEKVIKSYDRNTTFFYLDPPYYETTGYETQGSNSFTTQDHERLKEVLSNTKGKWLLSINDTPEIRDLYKDYYKLGVNVKYSISSVSNSKDFKELLIANYDICKIHDKNI